MACMLRLILYTTKDQKLMSDLNDRDLDHRVDHPDNCASSADCYPERAELLMARDDVLIGATYGVRKRAMERFIEEHEKWVLHEAAGKIDQAADDDTKGGQGANYMGEGLAFAARIIDPEDS